MVHPASGGPQLRIENSIKALSRISELDIINRDRLATNITNDFFQKYPDCYFNTNLLDDLLLTT